MFTSARISSLCQIRFLSLLDFTNTNLKREFWFGWPCSIYIPSGYANNYATVWMCDKYSFAIFANRAKNLHRLFFIEYPFWVFVSGPPFRHFYDRQLLWRGSSSQNLRLPRKKGYFRCLSTIFDSKVVDIKTRITYTNYTLKYSKNTQLDSLKKLL